MYVVCYKLNYPITMILLMSNPYQQVAIQISSANAEYLTMLLPLKILILFANYMQATKCDGMNCSLSCTSAVVFRYAGR